MDQSSTPGTDHASFKPEKTPVMFAGGFAFFPLAPPLPFPFGKSGAVSSAAFASSSRFLLSPIHARS